MCRTVLLLGIVGVLCFASSSSATIIAYDGFDYDGDGLGVDIAGRAGGVGFSGAWEDGDGDFDAVFDYTSGSLMYPSGSPGAGSEKGGRLSGLLPGEDGTATSGSGEVIRDINETDAEDMIGWNRDAVTYMSALVRKTGTASSASEHVTVSIDNGGSGVGARFGVGSNEKFFVGISTAATEYGTRDVVPGETYLLVAKMEASTSVDDVLSLWVYGEGDVVPNADPITGFDVSQTVGSGRSLERVRITFGNFNMGMDVDEVRIATTWREVVNPAIPEPATVTLCVLGIAAAAAFRMRRK